MDSNIRPYLETEHPAEVRGDDGDCKNPYCRYQFTPDDRKEMLYMGGYFTCPQCDLTYNYSA